MKKVSNLFAGCLIVILAALGACSTLTAPKGVDQQLAYAYASYASVVDTAADLVERGRMSKEDGRKFLADARQARTQLDMAKALVGQGLPQDAVGYLRTAQTILASLEQKLKEKQ